MPFGVQTGRPVRFDGMFHPVASDLTMAEAKRTRISAFGIEYEGKTGSRRPSSPGPHERVTVVAHDGGLASAFAAVMAMAGADDQRWELTTVDTRLEIAVAGNQIEIRRLEDARGLQNWAGKPMTVPLMSQVWVG